MILFRNLNSLGIIKIGVNNDQLETWGQQWSKYNWSTDDKSYRFFGRTFVCQKGIHKWESIWEDIYIIVRNKQFNRVIIDTCKEM